MAKKKKEKKPAEDWILKEVASRGVLFRIFASFVAITNAIVIGIVIVIISSIHPIADFVYLSWFQAVAFAVLVGVTLLLIIAFMTGMEEFDGSGPVLDPSGKVIVPESGNAAKELRRQRLEAKKARKEAKRKAKEEKKNEKKNKKK